MKHDQLVLFPVSAAALARPPADGVSQSCCGKVAKIAQYQISHFITGNATFTGDCDSRLPFSLESLPLSLATKGRLRLPFWPSFCAKSRLCPLTPNLRAASSFPQRNFWACFIAFGVAKKARERERGKEKHRKARKEGRQNGFFPHALLSRLLLLPVKQLLMICRQMVSGRLTFPPLALLQTGGWERRDKTFAPSA